MKNLTNRCFVDDLGSDVFHIFVILKRQPSQGLQNEVCEKRLLKLVENIAVTKSFHGFCK